ncbi:MAG: RNA polymerase sigma-70 factor [Gemmatimonadaceae bacterium]
MNPFAPGHSSIAAAIDEPAGSRERASAPSERLSWESAFEMCYADLCEYVLRFVGSAEAAEDLVHDLFLHLWEVQRARDPERLTRAYLFVSARNRALAYLRRRRVAEAWIERVSREEVPSAPSPAYLHLDRELDGIVAAAIAELPERRRHVFLLRRRDQMSYEEIAQQTGISVLTVKSHLFRATLFLRARLLPYLALSVWLWVQAVSRGA